MPKRMTRTLEPFMVARAALHTILTIQEQHVTSIMDLSPGNANLQNCCGIKQHLRTFERSKLTMLWLIPIPPLAGARRTKPPRSAFKPFCITNFPHNMPPQLVGVSIHVFVSVNIYIYVQFRGQTHVLSKTSLHSFSDPFSMGSVSPPVLPHRASTVASLWLHAVRATSTHNTI